MKTKIFELLQRFARSFDSKNWADMRECLDRELMVDYSSFRNSKPGKISRREYIRLRTSGLRHLTTTHRLKNPRITIEGKRANCKCEFEIKRFLKNSDAFFHSYGTYGFQLELDGRDWKIISIVQTVDKNEGDASIHGAFTG